MSVEIDDDDCIDDNDDDDEKLLPSAFRVCFFSTYVSPSSTTLCLASTAVSLFRTRHSNPSRLLSSYCLVCSVST